MKLAAPGLKPVSLQLNNINQIHLMGRVRHSGISEIPVVIIVGCYNDVTKCDKLSYNMPFEVTSRQFIIRVLIRVSNAPEEAQKLLNTPEYL